MARRSHDELFTGADGPFDQQEVSCRDAARLLGTTSWIATGVLSLVGIMLLSAGWDKLLTPGDRADGRAAVLMLIAGVLLPLTPFLAQYGRMLIDAERRWASTRGFSKAQLDLDRLARNLPLLRLGTVRRLRDCTQGELVDTTVHLANYQHHFDEHEVPMLRRVTRHERATGSWSIVVVTLPEPVARRYAGISVQAHALPIEDGAHEVQLESGEFHRLVSVHAAPDQDPVALRELLGPQLIAALIERPISWEQRGELLVVYAPRRYGDAERDELCADAAFVLEHYLTEDR